MVPYLVPTLLLLALSIGSGATHAPAGNPKRHAPTQSNALTAIPRRGNPFGNLPLSKPSRLSHLVDTMRGRVAKSEGKRDPKLGPGPGPDGEISARNRARRQAEKETQQMLQKRQPQGPVDAPSTTLSNTGGPSLTASAARATSSMNASHPTWILNDVYAGGSFWKCDYSCNPVRDSSEMRSVAAIFNSSLMRIQHTGP